MEKTYVRFAQFAVDWRVLPTVVCFHPDVTQMVIQPRHPTQIFSAPTTPVFVSNRANRDATISPVSPWVPPIWTEPPIGAKNVAPGCNYPFPMLKHVEGEYLVSFGTILGARFSVVDILNQIPPLSPALSHSLVRGHHVTRILQVLQRVVSYMIYLDKNYFRFSRVSRGGRHTLHVLR